MLPQHGFGVFYPSLGDHFRDDPDCHVRYEYNIRNLEHQFVHWHPATRSNPDILVIPSIMRVMAGDEEAIVRRHLSTWIEELHPKGPTSDMLVPYE